MGGPIQVTERVHWVGVLDPDLITFDIIMKTDRGTTYNAYLVQGETRTALVETVKAGFEGELLEKVGSLADPARIDYVVLNHTEPDHSGAVATVLERAPHATVVGTAKALQFLQGMLNRDFPRLAVKQGDALDLGGLALRFIPAPFLHWPDTMFTWLEQERVLFSCDVFGAHYADEAMLEEAVAGDFWPALRHYYQAIMGPFAPHVQRGLKALEGLPIETICPSHGPILRAGVARAIDSYRTWSSPERRDRPLAVVCYASIYGFTLALALAVAEGLQGAGAEVEMINLEETSAHDAAAACARADVVVMGSPTINSSPAPPAIEALAHLDPFRAKGKVFGAFGSYGWSGEAVEALLQRASELKMRTVAPGVRVTFSPTGADLERARDYGGELVKALGAPAA
ncbi:MAG TPA: FprA family A-type flavoprotein [Thermoanaerobaculaceae bacterium]|nr:FprA family A-type flavoprotein [Thermoanaerobaculaceae bacterium]HRS17270.1 FprA family A-type flavoprotein [Thermoanaerobaculaceae bacterium]